MTGAVLRTARGSANRRSNGDPLRLSQLNTRAYALGVVTLIQIIHRTEPRPSGTRGLDLECTVTTADWIETEVRPVMAMLGRKWAIAAVVALRDGPQRHRDLRRTMEGVSDKVLTATLRTLAASGIVRRELYPAVPPRVEYQLTPLGRSLDEALAVWVQWVVEHRHELQTPDETSTRDFGDDPPD